MRSPAERGYRVNLAAMLWLLQVTDTVVEKAEEILSQVPEEVGNMVDAAKDDPVLAGVLIGIGVITALVFVWGIVKNALKAAVIGALLSAGAWIWYFNIR